MVMSADRAYQSTMIRHVLAAMAASAGRRATLLCASGALLLLSLPAPARAQSGSGWTASTPVRRLQTRGCGTHSASGGVETFGLSCADTGSDNRAEQRIENDYSSGTRQFEGEVRVV